MFTQCVFALKTQDLGSGMAKIARSGATFLKSLIDFNLSAAFLECRFMHKTVQKMQDLGATVIHVHIVCAYIEKQWKSNAVE